METPSTPRATIRGVLLRSLVLMAIVPFLPLAALTFIGYRDDVERVESEIRTTNRQIAVLASHYLYRFLQAVETEAALAAESGAAVAPEGSSGARWEIVDADGTVVASRVDPARKGRDCGYARFLATVGAGSVPVHSAVGRWLDGHPPTVLVGLRVELPDSHRFVIGVASPDALHGELTASLGEALDHRVYVVDRTGALLFYSDPELLQRGEDVRDNPPVRRFRDGQAGAVRYRSTVTGKERLGYVEPVSSGELAVVVSADIGSGLIGLRDRYIGLSWSILFALLAVAAIVAWTSRRLLRPVLQIRDALRSDARREHGPLAISAQALGTAEYAELVRAFDEMEARLAVAEAGLLQAEKTALLGQLATGIAHEFGTPLNVVSGNAQLLMRKMTADDPNRQVLEKIVKQAERLAAMIRRVLDFARPTEPRLQAVDVGRVVAQALEMVSGMNRKVQVEVAVAPDIPSVRGDPRLLEHAILNLVVNAYQEMPDGGMLRVETGPDDEALEGEAPGVRVRVTDSGRGIPEDRIGRVFEPFFTTKAQGEGTGLGLAIVEQIVRRHGGRVEVRSPPGSGAEFTIRLPRARDDGGGSEENHVAR